MDWRNKAAPKDRSGLICQRPLSKIADIHCILVLRRECYRFENLDIVDHLVQSEWIRGAILRGSNEGLEICSYSISPGVFFQGNCFPGLCCQNPNNTVRCIGVAVVQNLDPFLRPKDVHPDEMRSVENRA